MAKARVWSARGVRSLDAMRAMAATEPSDDELRAGGLARLWRGEREANGRIRVTLDRLTCAHQWAVTAWLFSPATLDLPRPVQQQERCVACGVERVTSVQGEP